MVVMLKLIVWRILSRREFNDFLFLERTRLLLFFDCLFVLVDRNRGFMVGGVKIFLVEGCRGYLSCRFFGIVCIFEGL